MARLALSASIGLLCAVVFTIIRGGWQDAPFVVPIYAIAGFALTYVTASLIHHEPSATKRIKHLQNSNTRLTRDLVAAIIVASAFYWTGILIQGAGFAGWLVAIFLGVSLPLAVCLIASRAAVSYGVAAASAVTISTMLHHPYLRSPDWLAFLRRDVMVWTVSWCILLALSLTVSIPLTIQRSRITNSSTGIAGRAKSDIESNWPQSG